jgi:anti-sigma factor RsiW
MSMPGVVRREEAPEGAAARPRLLRLLAELEAEVTASAAVRCPYRAATDACGYPGACPRRRAPGRRPGAGAAVGLCGGWHGTGESGA